ncbi:MAG: hypothetical protein ABIJ21_04725 [Nanoarchaeota archaeon]
MSELQITVNSRTIERLVFVILIVFLLGLNIYHWTADNSPLTKNEVTGLVTDKNLAADKDTPTKDAAAQKAKVDETCYDGIKNQDETATDCGGICKGYWYDDGCQAEPKAVTTAEPSVECRMNSDCESGYTCEDGSCIEIPPECTTNADCNSNEECTSGKCEEKRLSGNIEVNVLDATVNAGTGEGTKKVTDVKLEITNGKSKSIIIYGKAYVYTGRGDAFYDLGKEFDIGTVKSGETITRFFPIDSMFSFQDDDEDRTIRVEIYDEDDEEVDVDGDLVKKIYP